MKFLWAFALLVLPLPVLAQEKRPLRWGADPTGGAPYVYQDASGKFIGFEVELADYLGAKLGRTSEMKKGDWARLPQLLDKPVDSADAIDIVLNGYELKESLRKTYAATIPYYAYRLALLTSRDNSDLKSWQDLTRPGGPKQTVGVLEASVAHEFARDRFGHRIELVSNQDVVTVIGRVEKKLLDATIQDSPAATYFLKEIPALKEVGEPR
ncbi:MAG TPA: transporter substrate-binding domain-containing protein, partial [Urbifossiella sp.]